jgi:restriction endonuclease S subunit
MKFEKLKNIVEVKKGKKPSIVEYPDENSVRVLQIDDLRNDTNPKFTNDKLGVFANEDDILIAWDGANAGTIGYGKSGYIGSTIALLRKKQPDLYSTTFIGIFLQSQYHYLRSKTTGATIPHISRKALDDLEVPVISVNDQLHIANILSKAENLIAQRKESIRLLDEFLKSTFLEMFGDPVRNEKAWEKVKIKDSGNVVTGTTPPSSKEGMFGGEIPFITPSDLESNEPNRRFVTTEGAENSRTVRAGATFICCIGATIGKVQRAKSLSAFNQQLNAIEWNNNFNDLFGERLMKFMKPRIVAKGGGSTTLPILNKGDFEKIDIIKPPLALQTQFAQIVEKTEALKSQYQQSLTELENLYGSLSQKAFKGELTLKNHANP